MEPRISSLVVDPTLAFDQTNLELSSLQTINAYQNPSFPRPSPVEPSVVKASLSTSSSFSLHEPNAATSHEIFGAHAGSSPNGPSKSSEGVRHGSATNPTKKTTKSAVPLAGVLNDSAEAATSSHGAFPESRGRKRRRLDESNVNDFFTLPKPNPVVKRNVKRPRIPPLLQGLHQPPPDAGLFPPITAESFTTDVADVRADKRTGKAILSKELEEAKQKTAGESTVPVSTKDVRSTKRRNKWTDRETSHLLRGVAKFGVGKWKLILKHGEYTFNSRTAVDLKDRFRTYCSSRDAGTIHDISQISGPTSGGPQSQNSPEGSKANASTPLAPKATETPSVRLESNLKTGQLPHKTSDLARYGIQGPFPKSTRRQRRKFNEVEDVALLRGFELYGTMWHKIRDDPGLRLESRSATDLRDRFRNRYPKKFSEAGYHVPRRKTRQVQSSEDQLYDRQTSQTIAEPSKVNMLSLLDGKPLLKTPNKATTVPSSPPASLPFASNTRYSSIHDPLIGSAFYPLANNVPSSPVTLNRRIFDWADQNLVQAGIGEISQVSGSSSEVHSSIEAGWRTTRPSAVQQSQGFTNPTFPFTNPNPFNPQPRLGASNLPPPVDLQELDVRPYPSGGHILWDDIDYFRT